MNSLASLRLNMAAIGLSMFGCFSCWAQVSPTNTAPTAQTPPLPITSQIKKTIVFLDVSCVHDFASDVASITGPRLLQLPKAQRLGTVQRLVSVTSQLQGVRASVSKLSV